MKKKIYLVRHARAEDQALMFKDFDRELLSSGIMDAARMGKFLHELPIKVDQIVSSTAVRAWQTAKVLAEQLSYDVEDIVADERLYDGGPRAYLERINSTEESIEELMMVGHNPDITYFAEYLTRSNLFSMDKGGVVTIEFEGLQWAEISGKLGKFVSYVTPKSFREN